jgi:hypothetical protein
VVIVSREHRRERVSVGSDLAYRRGSDDPLASQMLEHVPHRSRRVWPRACESRPEEPAGQPLVDLARMVDSQ